MSIPQTNKVNTLRNEVIPLSTYRETSKAILKDCIGGNRGSKYVFVDPTMMSIFEHGAFATELFQKTGYAADVYGVASLADSVNPRSADNVIYIVRPIIENLKLLREHIKTYRTSVPNARYQVYFCPKTALATHVMETEYGLDTYVNIDKIELDLYPLEDDVLSMEMSNDYRDLYFHGDVTLLHNVAQSIVEMQAARFGPIKTIKGKGKYAKKVVSIVERLQNEAGLETLMERPATVESMLIIDRSVDLVTPLMTQLTYEGLIDELFGIESASFYPPFETGPADEVKPKDDDGMVPLHNNDTIFQELRDRNFTTVGAVLRNKSLEVKQSYERRKDAQDLKDIKEFMRALPETQIRHRQIGVHTNIATQIGKTTQNPTFRERIAIEQTIIRQEDDRKVAEYIEDMINKGEDVRRVLRLMCLFSIVNGGIKPKVYDSLKEALLLSYGIPHMIAALSTMEQAGLILKNDGRTGVFGGIRKASRLWVEGLDERKQNDAGYAYSGYCPLLTRVVEAMIANHSINTNLSAAATGGGLAAGVGGMFDLGAATIGNIGGNSGANTAGGAAGSDDTATIVKDAVQGAGSSHITIIYIVGGATYAELSTLRYVAKQLSAAGDQRTFVFATTSITNGSRMLDNLLPFLPPATH